MPKRKRSLNSVSSGEPFAEHHLCDSCESFLSDPVEIAESEFIENGLPILQWEEELGHLQIVWTDSDTFPAFPGMALRAKAGCRLCQLFLQAISRHLAGLSQDHEIIPCGTEVDVCMGWQKGHESTIYDIQHGLNDFAHDGYFDTSSTNILAELGLQIYLEDDNEPKISISFGLCTDENSTVAKHLNIRKIYPNRHIISTRGVSLMQGWLHECEHQHVGACSGTSNQADLPSRLICVGSECENHQSNRPRIVDVETLKMTDHGLRYAALSYQWGPDGNPITTSKSNLDSIKERIDWQGTSPKTIQDAILVTEALGIKYLWIDALCIVQDDPVDKEREIVKMAAIYRNAYVTLVAASSDSSTDGFIRERSLDNYHSISFTSKKYPSISGQIYLVDEYLDSSKWSHQKQIIDSGWNKRGWTFQEYYMAKRIIFFGKDAMIFQCNTHYRSEVSTSDLVRENHWLSHSRRDVYMGWYRLVKEYSRRQLTDPTDRLPAISAMARTFRDMKLKDRYLAGLWEKDLLQGLLWHIVDQSQGYSSNNACVGPSWSWATPNSKLEWTYLRKERGENLKNVECRVLDAVAHPEGDDEFSKIRSGVLILSGRINKMESVTWGNFQSYFEPPYRIPIRGSPTAQEGNAKPKYTRPFVEVQLDETPYRDDIYLLFLGLGRMANGEESICGLMLRPKLNLLLKRFERVGTFSCTCGIFDGGNETTLLNWVVAKWSRETIAIV